LVSGLYDAHHIQHSQSCSVHVTLVQQIAAVLDMDVHELLVPRPASKAGAR